MKKHVTAILAALLCSVLFCNAMYAQKPTLESLLPADVQRKMPEMASNTKFILDRVMATNTKEKTEQQIRADVANAVNELKKANPSFEAARVPELTASSPEDYIAAKTKQLGAESNMVRVLNVLKAGFTNAATSDDAVDVMIKVIKSPMFESLAAEDKNMLYTVFASTKVALDYKPGNKKLTASIQQPGAGVGGFTAIGTDDDDYEPWGGGCHFVLTLFGGVIGFAAGHVPGAIVGSLVGFALGAHGCY